MEQWIFRNGQFVDRDSATVSVFDHGLLYGDGIFEGIRAYSGNLFRLREHLLRLYASAKSILLEIPYSLDEMMEIVAGTVRRNLLNDAYIRLVVTRGMGDLGLDPKKCPTAEVIVIAEQLNMFAPELYTRGIEVICAATRRNRSDVLSPKVKSLNYLNNILVKLEAHAAGVNEALVLNSEGYVVEGSGENVFLVRDGVVYTPPTYLGALEGITRQAVLEIAQELHIETREEPFTRHDVYVADEIFLTGTAAEMVPVIKVDGRVIGSGLPGEVTRQLHRVFQERTKTDGYAVYAPHAVSEGA
ncbi:branched-chain-amino-acid transaminase [Alicyclobacillus tolerans]|uniref:Branched-chain-amino-acid aminotransferase n=1 Tax=Alicyclobacillus tolerans TaxID=90970 RepID=A0A1M6XMA8_9BACL|nr:branched-chain-amino-acid transaminase [Alicyclobacillus montanus]SHL07036.1 branched chain amino acid aminotransferase apoenzyme [Alicyclobacillus montanus]